MNEMQIRVDGQRTTFEPAEEMTGTVCWQLDQVPRSVELRLFWFTRGKGTQDVSAVQTIGFDNPRAAETRPFRLRFPDSPYSFSGKLISLVWALELVATPSKTVTRVEFVMAPNQKEILLESLPDKSRNRMFSVG